ncbi:hypothetical protein [Acetivibrio straminisolvens]|uniref:Tetratricopeptide repeat protein n=1 Tax=Acetivibrio straminisolvens JCM 21531 TaxID=1294263 RepID=W4V4K0_9FIRM|nr:hypothetical protein [Acetivibrio straminisolvens]GAE88111.1 hypothetical protein JCM21531_1535 [Acetivibrio straminisolvens JCM 21531]
MINLGSTYLELSKILDKEENIGKAILIFEEVLKKIPKEQYPSIDAYAHIGWEMLYESFHDTGYEKQFFEIPCGI